MYRQYENPWKLEKRLAEAKEKLANCTEDYEREYFAEIVADLEERVNFAWQDNEYEEDYAHENYPEEEFIC